MFDRVEDISARLGLYLLVFGVAMGTAAVLFPFDLPIFLPVLTLLAGTALVTLSFSVFHWQISSKGKRTKVLWGVLLSPIVLYLPLNGILLYAGIIQDPRLQDFGAYYNAAVRFLNGAPLYQTTQEIPTIQAQISADMPYLYPPLFVLIFIPFTIFPPVIAGYIWDLAIILFLLWSISQLVSTFEVSLSRRERVILYFSVISFGPTVTWLKAGQVSGLLAALLCLSGVALRSGQNELSGVLTTLGSSVKPFYATSGAHLLRDRRRFLSALFTGVGILLLGVLLFGVNTYLEYLDVLREGKGWQTTVAVTAWNAGHFNPFFVLGPFKHLPRILIVLGTAGLALYSNNAEIPIEYIFALGIAIIPLAGPTANTLALNAVIPAIITVGFYEREQTGRFPTIILGSVLLLHIHPYTIELLAKVGPQMYPPISALTPLVPLLQPALYGMLLLISYILHRSIQTSNVGENI